MGIDIIRNKMSVYVHTGIACFSFFLTFHWCSIMYSSGSSYGITSINNMKVYLFTEYPSNDMKTLMLLVC